MSLRAIMTGLVAIKMETDDSEAITTEVKEQLTKQRKLDDLAQKSKAKHHNHTAHEPKHVQRPKNHDHSLDGTSRQFAGASAGPRRRGHR